MINFNDAERNRFSYSPLEQEVISRIYGISYKENPNIALDDLRYITVRYVDFNGNKKNGELISHKQIASCLIDIFYELFNAGYPIERIGLIDEYRGDDLLSMAANNSSCFNYRRVAGRDTLSKHAYGLGIDINPLYNPYITILNNKEIVLPPNASPYVDRNRKFNGKIDTSDLCYKLFTSYGFTWGGSWAGRKDYQHFEIELQ